MIRDTIETWQGSDADLLVALNEPRNKRKVNDGLVSLAMVGERSEPLAGMLAVTMKRVIATLGQTVDTLPDGPQKDQTEGQYEIFDSFFKRLKESSYGAPIDSDAFRNQFTAVAVQSGWDAGSIEAFLSLGAVVTSDAFDELGRDATQPDVDEVRTLIAEEAEEAARQLAVSDLQTEFEQATITYLNAALADGNRTALLAGLQLVIDDMTPTPLPSEDP